MIGPSVAPPAQYARADGDATQLPTPYRPGIGRSMSSTIWPSGVAFGPPLVSSVPPVTSAA